jgi:predicted DsbA family dithiol-disulfide isomerase
VPSLEVFADVWCPFAHVGLRMARQRRDALGVAGASMWIRSWPLELVNGQPQDPAKVRLHVADLREQIDPSLFAGFDPGVFPSSTLPALSLAAQAYRQSPAIGEAASFALRDALFEEGRDLSRAEVLTAIAGQAGMQDLRLDDHRLVIEEWHEGQRRGVEGSPHFFCRGVDSFCPSLDISRNREGHARLRLNPSRLDDFLDSCFRGGGNEAPEP